MANTILYSAIDNTEDRFPQYVAHLRAFLASQRIPAPSVQAVSALAAALPSHADLRDDLQSMLYVIRLGEPEMSTLELLAILLVAATGVEEAVTLQEQMPASGSGVRELFQVVKNATRSAPVQEALGEEAAFSPTEADWADADPQPWEGTTELLEAPAVYTGAGLSRALALSAEEDSVEGSQYSQEPVTVKAVEAPSTRESRAAVPAQTRPLFESQQDYIPAGARHRWLYAACGVLLGLLLGFFIERERPAHESSQPATIASAPATTNVAAKSSPTRRREPLKSHSSERTLHHNQPLDSAIPEEASGPSLQPQPAPAVSSSGDDIATAEPVAPVTRTLPAHTGSGSRSGPVKRLPLGPASDLLPGTSPVVSAGSARVFTGTAGIMAANVLSSPAPAYPVQASAAAVQGEVVVEAIVGRDGEVIDTRVVSGPLLLREAALSAVQRWRYRPYEVDGRPEEIATTARLDFRLAQR